MTSYVLDQDYRIVGDLKVTDKIMNDPGMGDDAIKKIREMLLYESAGIGDDLSNWYKKRH